MARTSIAQLTAEPGERRRGQVIVPGLDPIWEMPAVVIRGQTPGPTLAVTSGMHAAEYVPIEAVTRLTRWTDPTKLRGTLVAVLLVNTPGFYERSIYVNPRDGRNLNRAFPGDSEGSPAERVAAFLLAELIEGSDAYVDAHCGDLIEALSPFTVWTRAGDPAVAERSRRIAAAYGFEHTLGVDPLSVPGAAYASGALLGVPSIIAEIGQQGICDEPSVERHLRGLQNVMAHLEMIDSVGDPPPPPMPMDRMVWMRTDVSATYHPTVQVGEQVTEGQLVGELRTLYGDTISELRAVAGGIVVFLVTSLAVKEGDPLMGIGVPEKS
ncbi:MAG: succinylglutamate desuccinylase/aspartoacylase family protein [Candidatus Dormiibacterota bacterium]